MRCFYIRRVHLVVMLALLLAICSLFLLRQWAHSRPTDALSPLLFQRVIIVDAGHGGVDPGVVGRDGTLEKDIDLSIAQKLSELLRMGGASVTMTREQDRMLGDGKSGDLSARVQMAAEADPAAFISVHGNSFPSQPSARGAQVFFFSTNEQGQLLAQSIQKALTVDLGNTQRVALAHQSAYILKHIAAPAVVVEVGFLSNSEEEALLKDDDYQWRVAWAIYDGLLGYLALAAQPEQPQAELEMGE